MEVRVGRKGSSEGGECFLNASTDNIIPTNKTNNSDTLEYIPTPSPPCLLRMEDPITKVLEKNWEHRM